MIRNGSDITLDKLAGSVPNVGGSLLDWFQKMTFYRITTTTVRSRDKQTAVAFDFRGVMQPMGAEKVQRKPEGMRDWKWYRLHADPSLIMNIDEVVIYHEKQYRVQGSTDFREYGYMEYELTEDYTGAGPEVTT